jgi:hypothetical protein
VIIENEFGLGFIVGLVVPLIAIVWLYRRSNRDSRIIRKGAEAIRSYNDIQERNMRFYQENEKELLGLLHIAVQALEEADNGVEADALTLAVNDWVAERNIEGVTMNAEFLLHSEKVDAFKDLIIEDAREEKAYRFRVSGEIHEQPLLRLVKNSSENSKK